MAVNMKFGGYFDSSQLIKQIKSTIKNVEKISNVKINFDIGNLNEINSKVNKVYSKIGDNKTKLNIDDTQLEKVNNKINEITSGLKKTSETNIRLLNTDEDLKAIEKYKDEVGNTISVLKDFKTGLTNVSTTNNIEKQEKDFEKLNISIDQEVKKLETLKQKYERLYGNNIDTSKIDNMISGYKSFDKIDLTAFKNQVKNNNIELKSMVENAKQLKEIKDIKVKTPTFKSAEDSAKVFSQTLDFIDNKITDLNNKKSSNIRMFGNTDEVKSVNSQIDSFINKLNSMKSSNNGMNELKTSWNQINNTIKETTNNLKNVKVDNRNLQQQEKAITSIENKIKSLETKKMSNVRIFGDTEEIKQINAQIDAFISKLNSMKSSSNLSPQMVNNEWSKFNTTLNQSIELARQGESTFSKMTKALSNVGIYVDLNSMVRSISNGFKEASEYIKVMDERITNIQMITGESKNNVIGMTENYKKLGEQMHVTNKDILAGSEEMLRAGYSEEDASKLMKSSILGSKISGQDMNTMAQQIIAIKNAFNMTGDEIEGVIDKITLMDNKSATSTREISEAIKRTAYTAQSAGTSLDDLIAYITTISEKTRLEPEKIGNGLKSIYSRYENIKLGNLDDEGKSINDTEKALGRIGIKIREDAGTFRDFGSVLDEFIAKIKEGKISQIDMLSGVQALGGTYNRDVLLSLIQNVDTLKQHQEEMSKSTGNAEKMFNEAYSDSVDAKINDMKRSIEQLYEKMLTSDSFKEIISLTTNFINVLGSAITTIGGVKGAIEILLVSFAIFKKDALIGGISAITGHITALLSLAKTEGIVATATMEMQSIFATNPFGVILIGVTALISAFGWLKDEIKDLSNYSGHLKETTDSLKEVNQNEALVKQYDDLEEKIKSGKLSTEELTQAKKDLLNVQKQLAEKYPEFAMEVDDEGNKIATSIDSIKNKINQDKSGDIEKAQSQYTQLYNSLTRGKRNPHAGGKPLNSEIENFANLEATDKQYDETKEKLINLNNAVIQLKENQQDISDMKIYDFDKQKLVDAEEYFKILEKTNKEKEREKFLNYEAVKSNEEPVSSIHNIPLYTDNDTRMMSKEYERVDILSNALKELKETGDLSQEAMIRVGSSFSDLSVYGKSTSEMVNILTQALEEERNKINDINKTTIQPSVEITGEEKVGFLKSAIEQLQTTGEISDNTNRELTQTFKDLGLEGESTANKIAILSNALQDETEKAEESSKNSIKNAQKDFYEQQENISLIIEMQKEMSENGKITDKVMKELATNSVFSDFLGDVTDLGQAQDYLNSKIQSVRQAQGEAYNLMRQDSAQYYSEILSMGNGYQESVNKFAQNFVDVNSSAYDWNARNYKTLAESKQAIAKTLAESEANFLAQYCDDSADTYKTDLQNFADLSTQKTYMIQKLDEQINKLNKNLIGQSAIFTAIYEGQNSVLNNRDPMYDYRKDQLEKLRQQIAELEKARAKIDTSYTEFVTGIDATPPNFGGYNSTELDKNNQSGKQNEKQKSISLIKDEADIYKTAESRVKAYQNALNMLDSQKKNKDLEAQNSILRKQIEYYDGLKDSQIALMRIQEGEFNRLKRVLSSQGFTFGNNGEIANYTQRLNEIRDQFNRDMMANPDNSSARNEQFKTIQKWTQDYLDLLDNKLPSVRKEIEDIRSSIIEAKKEILTNQRDQFIDKEEKKIDKLKETISKTKDEYQKLHDEMTQQDELNEKQTAVDKAQKNLLLAQRSGDSELIKKRTEELKEAQKQLNDTTYEQNYNSKMDRLDEESDMLDERLDKMKEELSNENIEKLAQAGVSDLTAYINKANNLTVELPKSFLQVSSYTQNISNSMQDWINKANKLQSIVTNLNKMSLNWNVPNNLNNSNKNVIVNIDNIDTSVRVQGTSQEQINAIETVQNNLLNTFDEKVAESIGRVTSDGNY